MVGVATLAILKMKMGLSSFKTLLLSLFLLMGTGSSLRLYTFTSPFSEHFYTKVER
jgi:hypothetical protein